MSLKSKIAGKRPAKPDAEGDDLSVQVANLTRDLAEARVKLGEHEKSGATWQSKAEKAEAQLVTERLNRGLYSAAMAAGAIDPDDEVELLRGKGARLDEKGAVVFGQGAETLDATAFVTKHLEAKPHRRKAAPVAQGSGAPATAATSAPGAPAPRAKPDPRDRDALNKNMREEALAQLEANRAKRPS